VHVSDYTVLFDQVEDGRSRRRSFAVPAESSSPGSDHFDEVRGDWAVLQYDGSGAFGSPVGLWLQAPRWPLHPGRRSCRLGADDVRRRGQGRL